MKRLFLFIVGLLVTSVAMAQIEVAMDTSFSAITSFLLPAVSGAALALWTSTVKHIKAGTWDWKIFLRTKLLPFGTTTALAVVVYFMMAHADWLLPFAEILAGADLAEFTSAAVFGFAARIVDDVIFKKAPNATS